MDAVNQHFHAIVDMGSNGIRFSIHDLTPPKQRLLTVVYASRAPISLQDAQYNESGELQPISDAIIHAVVAVMVDFRRTCDDFQVPQHQIHILATEATRTATNSEQLREAIRNNTGLIVNLVPKEEEGRLGALGIASSLGKLTGIVMDLGGGSTQMTWIETTEDGGVEVGKAVSLPLGAAALLRKIKIARSGQQGGMDALRNEVQSQLKHAFESLQVPAELYGQVDDTQGQQGLPLYLSGGGFRGWGYLLMSSHSISPYPIPLINGFAVPAASFSEVSRVTSFAYSKDGADGNTGIFRISERRLAQLPATSLLIECLLATVAKISNVTFCAGGTPAGYLFDSLDSSVRGQNPFAVGTLSQAGKGTGHVEALLMSALPREKSISMPTSVSRIVPALAHTLQMHAHIPKDARAASAIRCTSTGAFAGIHGVSHAERSALALALCERWGGEEELPAEDAGFMSRLQLLSGAMSSWWSKYLGRVANLVGQVYPVGISDEASTRRLSIELTSENGLLRLHIKTLGLPRDADGDLAGGVGKAIRSIEKLGKKKNFLRAGDEVAGHKIEVLIS